MHICKFYCLILVHSYTFLELGRVVAVVLKFKFCSYNCVLNEVPNNNDVKRVANIVLNEAPNSNDATHIGNNVRLTAVDAQQFLMAVT